MGIKKTLRLGLFVLVTSLAVLLAINFSLAWMYVSALTQPGCSLPQPFLDYDSPEEIWLKTEDDLQLKAWYYPSRNGAALLTLGGVGGSLGDTLPPVRALLDAGYGILQIDGRACAQPPRRATLGGDELFDAQAGLDYLLSRPEIDDSRIGAFGFSMGGVTSLRLAARHPKIQAVVAEGGYDRLGKHITQPGPGKSPTRVIFLHTVALNFWLQTGVNPWSINPRDDIDKIAPRPVLLIYGEHEIERGGGDLQHAAAGGPKELWIVPGGNHGSNFSLYPNEYNRRVIDFLDKYLLP